MAKVKSWRSTSKDKGRRYSPSQKESALFNSSGTLTNSQLWLAIAFVAVIYMVLRIHAISIPLDRDEGAFGYIGQLILDGKLPYRDAVDHKPPVVFYLYALALIFVPPTEVGIHLFLQFYNFFTLISVFLLLKIYFNSFSVAAWGAACYAVFSASPAIQGFTASTEMFMLLPIVLGLLFAVLGVRKNSAIFFILSGVVGAVAFWIKQPAITCVFFTIIYITVNAVQKRLNGGKAPFMETYSGLLLWGIGASITTCLIMGYFYQEGVFQELIYWGFTHNALYAGNNSFLDNLAEVKDKLTEILRGDFVVISVGLTVSLWNLYKKRTSSYFILGFLVLSLLGTIPGQAYSHYFAQLAPAVSIAGGCGFSDLLGVVRNTKRRLALALLCGLLLIGVPVYTHAQYFIVHSPAEISRDYFGYNPFPESKQLAEFIASRTKPEDPILVFGSEPQILFYSQRKSATSFPMIYPLMSSYPRYKEFQERVWQEIQSKPPKYVLIVDIHTSILWDGKADIQIFRQVKEMLDRDYYTEGVMKVTGVKGELVTVSDTKGVPKNEIAGSPFNIYIYRAKSN